MSLPDTIWFLLPLAIVGLVFIQTRPKESGGAAVATHKARLKALDEEEARGLLSPSEAEEARLEIKRRLLKAARTSEGLSFQKKGQLDPFLVALSIWLCLGLAVTFYNQIGSPTLGPSKAAIQSRLDQRLQPDKPENPLTYRQAMTTIRAELDRNPTAQEGWRLLAETAASIGDVATAAEAYGALASLGVEPLDNRLKQVQAMTALTQNQISPAVGLVLEEIRKLQPDHPAIDYYRGITALQARNNADAVRIWEALIARSPEDAWYVDQLKAELARMGQGPSGAQPQASGPDMGRALAPALDAETLEAAAALSPEEQEALINTMLKRLAERLIDTPEDAGAWYRLAEARFRLGQRAEALSVIQAAKKALPAQEHPLFDPLLDKLAEKGD